MSQEFAIRASGADKAALRHLVARFPLQFRPDPRSEEVANAPELKRPGDSWAMGQMEDGEAKPGGRGLPGQWVLEEQSGRPRFVGQPEGGLRDTGAGYFLLMKGRGNEFIAAPVSDMFTFKPALQRRHQSLEEAEAEMDKHEAHHAKANAGLARVVASVGEDQLATAKEEPEDVPEGDEEWKGITMRAAAQQEVKAAPKKQQQQQRQQRQQRKQAAGGGGQEQPEEDAAEHSDKGEDWEHEDVAADDDLDMGESQDDADVGSPVRKGGASDSDDEGGGLQPDKAKRRLKRMMRETGLGDSDDEGSDEDAEEESESIEDEEDLDRMAGVGSGSGGAREPTPETQPRPADGAAPASAAKKRKSPTPPAPSQPTAAETAAEQATKRARTGPSPVAAAAAAAAAPAAPAAAVTAAPAAGGGTVTAEELRQLFRSRGRILLSDLTSMYKARLTVEGYKQFTALVKTVARMEPGTKWLVLRE